jgi:hypothetical protein
VPGSSRQVGHIDTLGASTDEVSLVDEGTFPDMLSKQTTKGTRWVGESDKDDLKDTILAHTGHLSLLLPSR